MWTIRIPTNKNICSFSSNGLSGEMNNSLVVCIDTQHTCFSLRRSSSPPQCQPQLTIGWRCRPSRRSCCHLAKHWWTECPEDTDRQTEKLFIKGPLAVMSIMPGKNKAQGDKESERDYNDAGCRGDQKEHEE